MSKHSTKSDQISLKVMKLTTGNEFKVFSAWFTDSVNFNATQQILSDRTNIDPRSVKRIVKKLIEKEIWYISSKVNAGNGNHTNVYSLTNKVLEKEVEVDVKPCKVKSTLAKKEISKKQEQILNSLLGA